MYMHEHFLNALWKFIGEVEQDRDSFIQKTLKVVKTFKVKSLKRPKLDVLPK